jgi:hypothetical protein
MASWTELDQQFRELAPAMRGTRLDYQWGVAGTYYRLAGGGVSIATRRFEALAAIAGEKLQQFPAGVLHEDVLREEPAERWYEALRHHTDSFKRDDLGMEYAEDGTLRGHIYTGLIQVPAEASGLLALNLSALPPPQRLRDIPSATRTGAFPGLNALLRRERETRGELWLVLAVLIGLVLARSAPRHTVDRLAKHWRAWKSIRGRGDRILTYDS